MDCFIHDFENMVMKKLLKTLSLPFHILVGAYAVMLMLFSLFSPIVHAQHVIETITPSELERRLNVLDALNLDHRVTVIETTLQDLINSIGWYKLTSGGTGLLLMEAVYRHTKKKKEEEDNG